MVHRVYISSNLNSLPIGECAQLEGCTNANHITLSFLCYLFVVSQQGKFQEGKKVG